MAWRRENPGTVGKGQRVVVSWEPHRNLKSVGLPFSLAVNSVLFRLEDIEGKRTCQEHRVNCSNLCFHWFLLIPLPYILENVFWSYKSKKLQIHFYHCNLPLRTHHRTQTVQFQIASMICCLRFSAPWIESHGIHENQGDMHLYNSDIFLPMDYFSSFWPECCFGFMPSH